MLHCKEIWWPEQTSFPTRLVGIDSIAESRRRPHIGAMSVAFTKESDSEAVAADQPDRPISTHPNLVTATGLAAIDTALAAARAEYDAARAEGDIATDRSAMARATRDLRYWSARRASAQLVEAEDGDSVKFGATVTFERDDGRIQTYRITGEDEADPAAGSVSYVSPLAKALIGRRIGDTASFTGHEVEITAIG